MMASVTLEELCQDWKSVFLLSQLSGLRLDVIDAIQLEF